MGTLVCLHAHPDDEAIATAGAMALAKAEGHRVVLVVATRGEHGEVEEDFLAPGEQLGLRRVDETLDAARILGADRVEFLGYVDSGMMGESTNDHPYSFWRQPVDHAAARLAAILRDEAASPVVLTVYDDNGNYGHPDHIQVHRVGVRAAEMVEGVRVFEATMNRDEFRRSSAEWREAAEQADLPTEDLPDVNEASTFGKPEAEITHRVDVSHFADVKRAAMKAHASQIPETSFFLKLPDEVFARAFGTEWYIEHGHPRAEPDPFGTSLFD